MDFFLSILQGPYAYLLIFQIVIVASLVLSLIWLIARRTREAYVSGGTMAVAPLVAPSVSSVLSEDTLARIAELEGKLAALNEENFQLKGAAGDGKTLREKVKYLESKLLEYEILQEEIGTLGALKRENETLKSQLMHPGAAPTSSLGPVITATKPVVSSSPAPEPAVPEAVVPDLPSEPTLEDLDVASLAQATAIVFSPEQAAPTPEHEKAMEEGSEAADGLEDLLSEIDKLSTDKPS